MSLAEVFAPEHLAGLGHREIGFISEDISTRVRLPSFKMALRKNELKYNEKFIK